MKDKYIDSAKRIIAQKGFCVGIDCGNCFYYKDRRKKCIRPKTLAAAEKYLSEHGKTTPGKDPAPLLDALKWFCNRVENRELNDFKQASDRFIEIIREYTGEQWEPKTWEVKGRWLTWNDKRYYAVDSTTQPNNQNAPVMEKDGVYLNGVRYVDPDTVVIDDALACSRITLGPGYCVCWDNDDSEPTTIEIMGVKNSNDFPYITSFSNFKHARLATPEEIKEAQ